MVSAAFWALESADRQFKTRQPVFIPTMALSTAQRCQRSPETRAGFADSCSAMRSIRAERKGQREACSRPVVVL